jgi:hypothetical protein
MNVKIFIIQAYPLATCFDSQNMPLITTIEGIIFWYTLKIAY